MISTLYRQDVVFTGANYLKWIYCLPLISSLLVLFWLSDRLSLLARITLLQYYFAVPNPIIFFFLSNWTNLSFIIFCFSSFPFNLIFFINIHPLALVKVKSRVPVEKQFIMPGWGCDTVDMVRSSRYYHSECWMC